tara:strand:- start:828 stop:1316 length:489 start_codon:yes stop_codon:yes gene_type:complete
MAVKDISKKPYIVDNDANVKVGIDLPIRRDDIKGGWFASTTTTIESVKNNIRNLLNTNQGERLMQPNLGLNLKQILFEQINEESIIGIQDSILDTFSFWLPFVQVRDIQIETSEENQLVGTSEIRVKIVFNIIQDPNTLDSVTLNFQSDVNESLGSVDSGGY